MSGVRGNLPATAAAVWLAVAVPLVGVWEGLRLNAYRDPIGIPTICFGETEGVRMGDRKTRAECEALLTDRLQEFHDGLARCVPKLPTFPAETRAALVSWTYNVGVGAACGSTLARKANAGDLRGACNELPRWNKAGGRVLPGLTNRREAEKTLCLKGLKS